MREALVMLSTGLFSAHKIDTPQGTIHHDPRNGAPHVHVRLLPMQHPSNVGNRFANEGPGGTARSIACNAHKISVLPVDTRCGQTQRRR